MPTCGSCGSTDLKKLSVKAVWHVTHNDGAEPIVATDAIGTYRCRNCEASTDVHEQEET